jgi:hypothetical protein
MGTETYRKKGKHSKRQVKGDMATTVKHQRLPSMDAMADIGTVPPLERGGYMMHNYGKTEEKRKREGPGDIMAELRTATFISTGRRS